MKFFSKKEPNRLLVLIDFENLIRNLEPDISFSEVFQRMINKLTEIGEIVSVFVFTPPHLASIWGENFYQEGLWIINCPKLEKNRKRRREDTVDEILMSFGKKMIQNMNLTHLCIGTGDRDFSSLYREAKWKRLKVITVSANERSLSSKLISLSDKIILLSSLNGGQE